jgi:hypothetical protein
MGFRFLPAIGAALALSVVAPRADKKAKLAREANIRID